MEKTTKQVPIWFFIGSLLGIYGLLILGTGMHHLIRPMSRQVELGYLHADIWWGILLLVIGIFYCAKFWPLKK